MEDSFSSAEEPYSMSTGQPQHFLSMSGFVREFLRIFQKCLRCRKISKRCVAMSGPVENGRRTRGRRCRLLSKPSEHFHIPRRKGENEGDMLLVPPPQTRSDMHKSKVSLKCYEAVFACVDTEPLVVSGDGLHQKHGALPRTLMPGTCYLRIKYHISLHNGPCNTSTLLSS